MSADLLTIAGGAIQVELLPAVGARLHRLRVFGHDLLRTPDDPSAHAREPFRWGAYVMAPWCNRVAAAPIEVAGRTVSLASNFPDGSAIHGQVYAAPWEVASDGSVGVTGGGDGWPWPYHCSMRVVIDDAVVAIHQSLTNLAEEPMPAGLGLHPWFRRPVDIRVSAAQVVPSNVDPDSEPEPVAGELDLRAMRPVPDDLDATWLAPGDPAVELRWAATGVGATMRVRSDAATCICVASPSSLDGVAIEPQTHAPQGLRRLVRHEPGGLDLIQPGEQLRLTTQLAFDRLAAPAGGPA